MNWIKVKRFFSVIMINLIIIFSIFCIFEIICRLTFNEFKNNIHSPTITYGKYVFFTDFYGYKSRTSNTPQETTKNLNQDLILILGDSITGGYGHAYQDIWYNQLDRLLNIKKMSYDFKTAGDFGNNFVDNISNGIDLINKLEKEKLRPYKVIYQFNFNDLYPYTRESFKENQNDLFLKFAKWRYEHLNKSVFARVLQHYFSILRKNTSGSCEDRNYDALGTYTWTFGSKSQHKESIELWQNFEKNISDFNKFLTNKNIKFEIFMAPILFQIDLKGRHLHYNHTNLDFNCATIDPIKRIEQITDENNIYLYNPINYVRKMFDERLQDQNHEPFFFTADSNHFTPIVSRYIAEFISKEWEE